MIANWIGCGTGIATVFRGSGAIQSAMPPRSYLIVGKDRRPGSRRRLSVPYHRERSGRSLGKQTPSSPRSVGAADRGSISALVFVLAWQIAASLADSRLLPTVTAVLHAMLQQTLSGALPWNLAITLSRVAAAFTLSLLLGTALGVAMGCWRRLDLLLDNAVTVLLNLPALVVIVLIYVWFGLN